MRRPSLLAATAALVLLALPGGAALGARSKPVAEVGGGIRLHAAGAAIPPSAYAALLASRSARPAAATPLVGTLRNWLALDERTNGYERKPFTLAASGDHIEVWIANELAFPAGDCRNTANGGARVAVTAQQAAFIGQQFDQTIYPRESAALSVAPPRDGSRARANLAVYAPAGEGDNVVVLIDNVRDESFYDRDNAGNKPYIAGFFDPEVVEFFDRNVVTLDAYDWIHRTGPNPPHEPDAANLCRTAPARPFLYESTFAHEYQHLLEYYEDPNEDTWVDEGLADLAQRITGYVDARRSIRQTGYDVHVQCFLGWLGVRTAANPNPHPGGPENSLTRWDEHSADEVLCDYGAAYTFMEFLSGRYGMRFIRELHRDDASGLDGLRSVLRRFHIDATPASLVRDWSAAMALDGVLDRGAPFAGGRSRYRVPTLDAAINWATPLAYARAGAPPNGSDFVRLRAANGRFLRARLLRTLRFTGAPSASFSLRLVAYSSTGRQRARLATVPLRRGRASIGPRALRRLVGRTADVAAALVTVTDASGRARAYERYRLTVNGVRQPGG